MKHLSSDLTGSRLGQAISDDPVARTRLMERLGLDPAPLCPVDHDPLMDENGGELPVLSFLAGEEGKGTLLHLVIGQPGLARGQGLRNLRRAIFLLELGAPVAHAQTRVALVLPSERIAQDWSAAREFPNWIDAAELEAV